MANVGVIDKVHTHNSDTFISEIVTDSQSGFI